MFRLTREKETINISVRSISKPKINDSKNKPIPSIHLTKTPFSHFGKSLIMKNSFFKPLIKANEINQIFCFDLNQYRFSENELKTPEFYKCTICSPKKHF